MAQNPSRLDDVLGFKICKLILFMIFDWSNYWLKFPDSNFELQNFAAILSSKINL